MEIVTVNYEVIGARLSISMSVSAVQYVSRNPSGDTPLYAFGGVHAAVDMSA
jgi:hypothetical protein